MTAVTQTGASAAITPRRLKVLKALDTGGLILSIVTIICAVLWAFPLYWAVITTLKPEQDVVKPGLELWPSRPTIEAYVHILTKTQIGTWYINSLVTSLGVTFLVVLGGATCGYAISQLNFPGRRILWLMILASFMVPIQALIVNHFILMSQFKLINSWLGVI